MYVHLSGVRPSLRPDRAVFLAVCPCVSKDRTGPDSQTDLVQLIRQTDNSLVFFFNMLGLCLAQVPVSNMTPGVLLEPLKRWALHCSSNPTTKSPFCGPGGWDFDFENGIDFDYACGKNAQSAKKVLQRLLRPKATPKPKVQILKKPRPDKQTSKSLRPDAVVEVV